jgi:hypothetical protein
MHVSDARVADGTHAFLGAALVAVVHDDHLDDTALRASAGDGVQHQLLSEIRRDDHAYIEVTHVARAYHGIGERVGGKRRKCVTFQ